MSLLKFIVLGISILATNLAAQNADPLVYTVGNSYLTSPGKSHNFILWQPGDVSTTYGKRFAVFEKDGDPTSPDPFMRLGIQTVQTSPSAIQALLILGAKFDHDAASLPPRIAALHSEAQAQPLPADFVMPNEIDLGLAQKLAQIMTTAKTDPEILQSLLSLGRAHPGVMMAMGHGFAIEVPATSLKTYEVREIDAGNNDLRVIGRVTLNATNPSIPLPTGRPFPNPHPFDPNLQLVASAKDHLNVRLRWGLSDALRTALPNTYGFNLYRVPKGAVDPDAITSELLALAIPGAARVNDLPIAVSDLFTDAEAADLGIKSDVFFYADDKNPPADPFVDGETFFYYVATRDIAGHPGPLSPPTEITMCDRLPPSQPSILTIDNHFDFDSADNSTLTGDQNLRIVIRQVPELPVENSATKYRIYRWHSATDWQRYGGDPEFNFIGEVDHIPGARTVIFDDNDITDVDTDYVSATENGPDTGAAVANSENNFNMGKTFWYTVRSVDAAACDPPNLSGHSGALYGVIRDRVGPDKPSGTINRCYCEPRVQLGALDFVPKADYGFGVDFPGAVIRVNRTEIKNRGVVFRKIRSFEVEVGREDDNTGPFQTLFSQTFYFQGAAPFGDVIIPIEELDGLTVRVRVRLDDRTTTEWLMRNYARTGGLEDELQRYEFDGYVQSFCRPIEQEEGETSLGHYPLGEAGTLTAVSGTVNVTPGTHEVRVYRRVGRSSPLQLIFKIGGDGLQETVGWQESGPVITNGVEVCYFAQLFDEHGNGSPIVRLGCVTIVNDDLGIPLVTDPEPLPPFGGQGIIKLSWFCDPVGIDRFEVWIADESGGEPIFSAPSLTPKLETGTNPVLTTPEGDDLSFCIYQTPALGGDFGNGAEFDFELQVPYGRKYYYAIRPVGAMVSDSSGGYTRAEGSFSNLVCSSYVDPGTPAQPVVPWPARPLPGTARINSAVIAYRQSEGPFFATAIRPQKMLEEGCSGAILVGVFPSPLDSQDIEGTGSTAPDDVPPTDWLFHYRKQSEEGTGSQTESILRFVVYRHQVPSDRFPNARPNLVQITPLIDRIASYDDKDFDALRIDDPFFLYKRYDDVEAVEFFVPSAGLFSRNSATFLRDTALAASADNDYLKLPSRFAIPSEYIGKTMWVRDTLPVTKGAKYQYLIVHFTSRGEIARVIPTNIISH